MTGVLADDEDGVRAHLKKISPFHSIQSIELVNPDEETKWFKMPAASAEEKAPSAATASETEKSTTNTTASPATTENQR